MRAHLFVLLAIIITANGEKTASYWYRRGVEAYLENNWKKCIDHLETAIHKQRQVQRAISVCRISCSNENFTPMETRNIEDIQFYEKLVKKTLCFMKCKRTEFPNVKFEFPVDSDSLKAIQNLETYKYLQMCYHQTKAYQKAVSAAFTYIVRHPNDNITKIALKEYMKMPDIKQEFIKNFEAEDYLQSYNNGMHTYDAEDWELTIYYMEKALKQYYEAEDKCRAMCEGPFDQGWLPDFTASVANHFTFVLKCKLKCSLKLKSVEGLHGKKVLADMYNYLQFAYFKQNMIKEACRAVANCLLINPTDEDMLHNRKLYSTYGDDDMFTPHKELIFYLKRHKYENKLLSFINKEFSEELKIHKALLVTNSENEIPNRK